MNTRTYFVALALFLSTGAPAIADGPMSPTSFTYQGRLKQDGVLFDSTPGSEPNVRFWLYDVESGGTPVNPVPCVFNGVNVERGLFSVNLDFGADAFDGSDRWLQVDVAFEPVYDFIPLTPRQAIGSAPMSANTRGLQVDDDNNVGIGVAPSSDQLSVGGATDIAGPLEVDGTIVTTSNLTVGGNIGVVGSVTAGSHRSAGLTLDRPNLNLWCLTPSGNGSTGLQIYNLTSGESVMFCTQTGLIGVGTETPTAQLHLVGDTTSIRLDRSGFPTWTISPTVDGEDGLAIFNSDYGAPHLFLSESGQVGIRTDNPASSLDVAGIIRCNGTPLCSDERLKTDVAVIDDALDRVRVLDGVHFNWRHDEFADREFADGPQFGFIAQDVGAVMPEVVFDPGDDGFLAVEYDKVVPVLVEAIKELDVTVRDRDETITHQQHRITDLEDTVDALMQRLTALEQAMEMKQ